MSSPEVVTANPDEHSCPPIITDSEGFEIPEEYLPLATEKDRLMSLSLFEYNRFINKKGAIAELYRLECIKNHLIWGAMTEPKEIVASYYDPETHSIITKPGYTFDSKTCTFWRLK